MGSEDLVGVIAPPSAGFRGGLVCEAHRLLYHSVCCVLCKNAPNLQASLYGVGDLVGVIARPSARRKTSLDRPYGRQSCITKSTSIRRYGFWAGYLVGVIAPPSAGLWELDSGMRKLDSPPLLIVLLTHSLIHFFRFGLN